jgi:hypothetical protein
MNSFKSMCSTAGLLSRRHEPTLKELLTEPITRALMDADDVDPEELVEMLRRTTAALRSRSTGSDARGAGPAF